MAVLFNNNEPDESGTLDLYSPEFTLDKDVNKVTAEGDPWGASRIVLYVEKFAGSGQFVAQNEWELTGPGSKLIQIDGSLSVKAKLRLFIDRRGGPAKISAWND